MNDLNRNLVTKLREIVNKLQGDRWCGTTAAEIQNIANSALNLLPPAIAIKEGGIYLTRSGQKAEVSKWAENMFVGRYFGPTGFPIRAGWDKEGRFKGDDFRPGNSDEDPIDLVRGV